MYTHYMTTPYQQKEEGMEVWLHAFFTWAPDDGKWSVRPRHISPRDKQPLVPTE